MSSWNKVHPNHQGRAVLTTPRNVQEAQAGALVAKWDWAELDIEPSRLERQRSEPEGEHRPRQEESPADVASRSELEAAYRRGVNDGKDALRETLGAELELAHNAALSAVDKVGRSAEGWTARLQENLVALAAGIARQIVEREIAQDPEILRELTRRAVAAFPMDEPVKVRLHPDDLALLATGEGRAAASTVSVGDRTVPWISDPAVERGGCLVEGPTKIVDGRLDDALQRVYRKLIDD